MAGENSTTELPVLVRNIWCIICEPNLLQPGLSALHTARKIRRHGKNRKANNCKLLSVVNPAQHASDNIIHSALDMFPIPLQSTKSLISG